jgi:hypothetical protein
VTVKGNGGKKFDQFVKVLTFNPKEIFFYKSLEKILSI